MTTLTKMVNANEARFEHEKNFDPVAYAEEVMKTVGADFHEDDPLFQTNEFRMHCYKILPCSKHFCHDWSVCPFAHFSERAKRRDPKEVRYTAIACPDMKKGEECPRGDRCPYSHNTFEYWLHPTRYRTRLCRDNEACNRKICFFAHKPEEVRVPSARPSLPISEEAWTADGFGVKEEKGAESLPMPAQTDVPKMDQVSQIHAILNGGNRINTTPKSEPTFVDQVLSGMLPSSGVPHVPLNDVRDFQIAQAAPNLPFDSCFQTMGLSQGVVPSVANSGCFSMLDAIQNCGQGLNAFPSPALPFASAEFPDLSFQQFNYPQMAAAKGQADLNEVIQLLSNMPMGPASPTSVLQRQSLSLPHQAFADGNNTSGIGISDSEMDNTQMANALMGFGGPAPSAGAASAIFGMNLN